MGVAQVGLILVLTVVGLPCAFFTLLALLDRFERSLSPSRGPEHAIATVEAAVPVSLEPTVSEPTVFEPTVFEPTAVVVSLPNHVERPATMRAANESSAAAV